MHTLKFDVCARRLSKLRRLSFNIFLMVRYRYPLIYRCLRCKYCEHCKYEMQKIHPTFFGYFIKYIYTRMYSMALHFRNNSHFTDSVTRNLHELFE